MNLLKATTTEGAIEYFNLDRILTLQPNEDGTKIKILMGAGLYWWVWADSITILNASYNEIKNILGGKN